MDLRDPPSRLGKLGGLLPGRKHKLGRMGADAGGEVYQAHSVLSLEPYIVADEENDANADGRQVRSADRLAQPDEPESVPAGYCVECEDQPAQVYCESCTDNFCEACFATQHRKGSRKQHKAKLLVVAKAKEPQFTVSPSPLNLRPDSGPVSQRCLHPHSDVEIRAGSGPSRERNDANGGRVKQVYLSPSIQTPHSGEPDNVVNTSTIPDHVTEVHRSNQSLELSAVADEKELDLEPILSLLRTVRESSNAFPPLKSIAGDLCSILENPERTASIEQAVGLLAPRINALAESLGAPATLDDIREEEREKTLERKLEDVRQGLTPLVEQGNIAGVLAIAENAQRIDDLLEDIHEALREYKTSLQQNIYDNGHRLIESTDLTLLRVVDCAYSANHRSGKRMGCLRGTRKGVLWEIERWLTGNGDRSIFWLNGLAGTGKSAIAQTFAETAFADGMLGASFFCSRGFEDRSNLQAIFPTLAFQLAFQYPLFREMLLKVLKTNSNVSRETLSSQMEKVIVGPLKATGISTLIIIDALDECRDEEPVSSILSILSRFVDEIPNVKFFITGRPEPRIRSGFRLQPLARITQVLMLHEVKSEAVNSDIKRFFRALLVGIAKRRSSSSLTEDWASSSDIEILCKKAAGFFFYASAIVRFIASRHHMPRKRLALITSSPQNTSHEGGSGLDSLYIEALIHAVGSVDDYDDYVYSHFKTVVGAVLLVFSPLSIKGLSTLLGQSTSDTHVSISLLSPLLLVPDSQEDPIRIFHKSFPDFLTDPERCRDKRFFLEPATHHTEILLSCLNLIKERSKKNTCSLGDRVVLNGVGDLSARRKDSTGDALEYACRFWTKHLLGIPGSCSRVEEVQKAIDEFFATHLLFWIEVLSLTRQLDSGLHAIIDIRQWYLVGGLICKWTDDSQRFILEYFDMIRDSPSKIYRYALPFSPSKSWLREYYGSELSREVEVVKGLQNEWGACSRTIPFDDTPRALAFWQDFIGVGFQSGAIAIFDAITGIRLSLLPGHIKRVRSLAFSLDGVFLVSGSDDTTVNLWDVQTGAVSKTFHGHTHTVCSVSISPDNTTIASGSLDKTIRLWDAQTMECHRVMDGFGDNVNSVNFSPMNPRLLISASGSHTVQQWDIDGRQIGPVYGGDHAAFSSDGVRFISWRGKVAVVRNSDSGEVIAELQASDGDLRCCCFSPDDRLVAGGVDRTIYIWDITGSDPRLVQILIGHTDVIASLTLSFPPTSLCSLISASEDNTVRFWQIDAPSAGPAAIDLESSPFPPAPITSISLQTKDGIAISSNSAGVVQTWDLSTGLCKASFHTAVKGGRDVRLIDGKLIIVCDGNDWSDGEGENGAGKIQIWDVEKDELLRAVDTPERGIIDLWMSGDGAKIFCLCEGSVRAFSTRTGEDVGEVTFQGQLQPDSLTVGGTRVWVHFAHSPPQGWDFGIPGSPPVPLSSSSPNKPRLDITDSTEAQNTGAAKIKNATSGRELFQLPGRFANPCAMQSDHRYLVAGYESGEVVILDFTRMLPQ